MVACVPSDREARDALHAAVAARVAALAGDAAADAGLQRFVDGYLTHSAYVDLALADADHLAHAALAHWRFGATRAAGKAIVRVYTPTVASDGWDAPHTLIDIVNDDMPFLVDSATMAVDRHDLGIHLVVHPVLDVQRSPDGALLGVHANPPSTRESWVHIEVDRETSPEVLEALRADLERVLGDVRAATGDWLKAAIRRIGSSVKVSAIPSVSISAVYCLISALRGSVRMRTNSSLPSASSSTRIGKRPCSSGIRSDGFDT